MFDLAVIGSGPGGYVAAVRAAQLGAKVAVVEARDLGGTCLNRGCIPTKAMVKSAEAYKTIVNGEGYGVRVKEYQLDFPSVIQRKQEVVNRLVTGVEKLFSSNGITCYRGKASIPKPGMVEVSGPDAARLETRFTLIATGSGHALPPVPEAAIRRAITSDEALCLPKPPESMLVIGGGVLGVEFACIYAAFGTKIDIIKRSPLVLPPVDEELSKRIMPLLARQGIKVNAGIFIKDIQVSGDGAKRVIANTKEGKEVTFEAEEVLIAMGRVPDFGGLDLAALGIEHDSKGIKVDNRMRTSLAGVYAIGDVVGKYYLAPVASREGIIAVEDMFSTGSDMDYKVVPQCVFSSPEAASVGFTERAARDAGYSVKVSRFPFSANGKAVALGEAEGMVKVVADGETGLLLGMHILGPHATEIIHEAAIAIVLGGTAEAIATMIHAHPTLPEAIMEACHGIMGHPIHLAKVR
ncbi:MAG: dihydrolipoyl dehydrogenase [Bacillota bacterium]